MIVERPLDRIGSAILVTWRGKHAALLPAFAFVVAVSLIMFALILNIGSMIKQLAAWPRLVEAAAEAHEPHRIAFYLYDLAAAFHGLWTKGKDEAHLRFLLPQEPELTKARVALVQAVAFVVASGLETFGVEPVEEMR